MGVDLRDRGIAVAFDWLREFQRNQEKAPDYVEKTLGAYALGMRAHGAIVGVAIDADPDGCAAAREVAGEVYDPLTAPRLPLAGCARGAHCRCVYRPVMRYQRTR
ncbi:hypothetical protein [Anaeromyxobacter oryzisoli]|uniref:hypothetical protein n=1 Tax=Anaeromyxobacter oryzisoli TaxID=2925408 RepID=UPI001F59916B|nr:hypothetical protein [Anaeromyxobacter sp. SG63]